jgi:hypothetical protein
MRPEKVTNWREQLPPPFNKPSLLIKRRASVDGLTKCGNLLEDSNSGTKQRRRHSICGLDRGDRKVNWLRFFDDQYRKKRREDSSLAIEKLRR